MASTTPLHMIDIDAALFAASSNKGIDVRSVCEGALRRALAGTGVSADDFYTDHKVAIDRYNARIEAHGIPFEDMRAFR